MARTELDLLCLGRAAVDLYGEQIGAPLEDVSTFSKSLGGCAANIAVGAARQGLRVGMLTRVGDEAMGRFVKDTLRKEGVDVRGVSTDPERLTGLVLLSIRDAETFPLIFYRTDCADMALEAAHVDRALVASAKAVLLTGTHLSTERVRSASRAAVVAAKAAGRKVVLDVDYRPVLWRLTGHDLGEARYVPSRRVTEVLQGFLPDCDLVVGTEEELRIAGGREGTLEALRAVRARTAATIVLKRGPEGCVIFEGEVPARLEDGRVGEAFEVEVLNVLGAGDAFMAGFLRGWLEDEDLEAAARFGNACGALVVSRHACAPAIPTRAELDGYLARTAPRPRIDLDPGVARAHWVGTRPAAPAALAVLAFDHRHQLEDLAAVHGADPGRLGALKSLLAEGAARAQAACRQDGLRFGVIVDAQYGRAVLDRLGPDPRFWVARPIEQAADTALGFVGDPNVELELRAWPRDQVVKCLVHPVRADHALTQWQNARLVRLAAACRALERSLLVEVLPRARPHAPVDPELLPEVVEQLYRLGIRPDWWKLPPPDDDDVWRALDAVVAAHDPDCHGVLVLGLDKPKADLRRSLQRAREHARCRGFAVGRSIFFEPADRWLAGRARDEDLVAAVSEGLCEMVDAYASGGGVA